MKRVYRSVMDMDYIRCAFKFRKKSVINTFQWICFVCLFVHAFGMACKHKVEVHTCVAWGESAGSFAEQNFRCLLQIHVDMTALNLESGVDGSVGAAIFPCDQRVSSRTVKTSHLKDASYSCKS